VRRSLRWVIVAAVVVVLAIGGAVAWYVFGDDAPARPSLSDEPVDVEGGASSDAEGNWRVAPADDVYVGYRIKELFAGSTIKRDAVGRTPDVDGALTISGATLEQASVTADVTTLDSGRAARDAYLRENALQTNEFPDATFELTGAVDLPTEVPAGEQVEIEGVRGTLTLHGETQPIVLTLDARFDGRSIEVAGSAPIVLADFGIERPDTAIVDVDDNGSLELHLRFTRS
jgi:polyisoprenoid-binding protein YceI